MVVGESASQDLSSKVNIIAAAYLLSSITNNLGNDTVNSTISEVSIMCKVNGFHVHTLFRQS